MAGSLIRSNVAEGLSAVKKRVSSRRPNKAELVGDYRPTDYILSLITVPDAAFVSLEACCFSTDIPINDVTKWLRLGRIECWRVDTIAVRAGWEQNRYREDSLHGRTTFRKN
jgi:hypothetical protein